MKKLLTCVMMLLTSMLAFADDWGWDEKTRDAAYEAPNSKFQKKWYDKDQNETTFQFGANGVVTAIQLVKMDNFDARIVITLTGKYTRNKDHLNITWTGVQTKPNQTDMDALSARNRDQVLESLKSVGPHFASNYKNKTEYYLILRLDDECLIITKFDPQSKLFNDLEWTTLFNESHKKKEEERENRIAELEAKKKSELVTKLTRQDSTMINNHVYVDLGLSSGTLWATCDVGASTPAERGERYSYGEINPREKIGSEYKYSQGYNKLTKYCTSLEYTTSPDYVDNKTRLDPEDDVAHVKWGGSWRIPTKEDVEELKRECTWEKQELGYVIYGKNGNMIFFRNFSIYGTSDIAKNNNSYFTVFPDGYATDDYLFDSGRDLPCHIRPVCNLAAE